MYFYDNGIKISESDLKEALAYSDPYTFLGREIFKCIQDVMKRKIETDATYALRFALLARPLEHVKEINVKFKEGD